MMEQKTTRPPGNGPTSELPTRGGVAGRYLLHLSPPDYGRLDALAKATTSYVSAASSPDEHVLRTHHAAEETNGLPAGLASLLTSDRLPIPREASSSTEKSGLELLADGLTVASFASRDLLQRVHERWSLYRQHTEELDEARRNAVAVRRDWRSPLDDRPYLGDPDLLRDLHRIDAERRSERNSMWRDLDGLRSQLPEQWKSYLASYRRHELVTDLAPPSAFAQPVAEPTAPSGAAFLSTTCSTNTYYCGRGDGGA